MQLRLHFTDEETEPGRLIYPTQLVSGKARFRPWLAMHILRSIFSANLIRENYAWEEPELDSIMVKTTGCGVIQTELKSQL